MLRRRAPALPARGTARQGAVSGGNEGGWRLNDFARSSTSLGLVFISHPQFGRLQTNGRELRQPVVGKVFDGILTRGGGYVNTSLQFLG